MWTNRLSVVPLYISRLIYSHRIVNSLFFMDILPISRPTSSSYAVHEPLPPEVPAPESSPTMQMYEE